MIIEKIKNCDIDEIVEIENSVFSDPWSKDTFVSTLKDSEYSINLALKDDKKIIGYILIFTSFEDADILNIAVKDEFQGKGLGELLLKQGIKEAYVKGCRFIHLEVRVSNVKAYRLYKKMNFKEVRIRKNYYGNEDAIDMIKEINEEDISD